MKRMRLISVIALVFAACQDATHLTTPDGIVTDRSIQAQLSRTFTVTNTNDAGAGSLRQAILDANASAGLDLIGFSIPGAGLHTIQPTSALPAITDPVVVDGYTQPGAYPNTNGVGLGSNATLRIELDGSKAGHGADGLTITAGGSTVRGLVINRFGGSGTQYYAAGIQVLGYGRNVIEGNFIGVDATGTSDQGNSGAGIRILSSHNTIGGTAASAKNVISGNGFNGVFITFAAPGRNVVQGNLLGTDASGTLAIGNSFEGVRIINSPENTVGGTAPSASNVISGNQTGLSIAGGQSVANVVQGNFIGTDVSGRAAVGNARSGVFVSGSSSAVGGIEAGAGNTIAFNGGSGVVVALDGSGNAVMSNTIASNGGLGIDLGDDGVTLNDAGDTDVGANNLQNFPVLRVAVSSAHRLVVKGTIDTPEPKGVTIEWYANPMANSEGDPTGHGEGKVFLGRIKPSASGRFTATLPAVEPGSRISATATDAAGNTSEFAVNIVAGGRR